MNYSGRISDIHAHIYTKRYLKELEKRNTFPVLRTGSNGLKTIQYSENLSIPISNDFFFDIEKRMREMEKFGITTEVLSGVNPWTDAFPQELAVEFSRIHNDDLAEISKSSNGRFLGLATLPMLSPEAAAEELVRAIDELALSGAIIGTNVRGEYVSEEKFLPVFEAASKKKAIIFLHPARPLGAEKMRENGLVRSLGYVFDTTLCLAKMSYAGLFDRFPSLKIISAHLGGAYPYLRGRIDTAWANMADSKGNLNEAPSSKVKKTLFVDTISYNKSSLETARDFLGIDRLIFGTDFPFDWGIKEARQSVEGCFEGLDLERVYHENLETLLSA